MKNIAKWGGEVILYKYLGLKAALKMIEKGTLGFTKADFLNDPTETTASYWSRPKRNVGADVLRQMNISDNFGILSMTRNPLNAIMWSHYGQSHSGLVVGIDVNRAGLNDIENCLIPAKYGSVIYTKSKPIYKYQNSAYEAVAQGEIDSFNLEFLEVLQRFFLYKSSEWHYEEEVRVVKTIDNIEKNGGGRLYNERDIDTGMYLIQIPKAAFVSVHFGLRSSYDFDSKFDLAKRIQKNIPKIKFYDYRFDRENWLIKERALAKLEKWPRTYM